MGKYILKPLENTVVHTPTEAEFKELMQIYEDAGWVWHTGGEPTDKNIWGNYGSQSCVETTNMFCFSGINYYRDSGGKIITLQEFKKLQGIESEPQIEDIDKMLDIGIEKAKELWGVEAPI